MDTDDSMSLAMESAVLKEVFTERVANYLKILAAEHIDGGFEDDERDWHEERDQIWWEMTRRERDTTNYLVEAIFSDWI